MRRIRQATRVDRLSSQKRSGGIQIGRWIYLALLVALGLWLLDFVFGDYFYLQANGLVTRETRNIGSPNIATVDRLLVKEGDRVKAGQHIATLSSQQAVQEIANLSTRVAELEMRGASLRSRQKELEELVPVAKKRFEAIERLRQRREQAIERGLETERQLHDLMQAEYDAIDERAELVAESKTVQREASAVDRILSRLNGVLNRLEGAYNEGALYAPVTGRVGKLEVSRGSVVRPGNTLMDIVHGKPYVLGYVESGALFEVEQGQQVRLRTGLSTFRGEVAEILPISARLPEQFQQTFRPPQRSQVIRIRLLSDEAPPTYSRVEIVAASGWWRAISAWMPW